MRKSDPRLHIVAITCHIRRNDGRYLILRRSDKEIAYPGKWAAPGGKLVLNEYQSLPKVTSDAWSKLAEFTLKKEIKEEAGIEVEGNFHYYTNYGFVRPDNIPVFGVIFWTKYEGDENIKPGKDFTDFAWVTASDAKSYELIEGVDTDMEGIDKIIKRA